MRAILATANGIGIIIEWVPILGGLGGVKRVLSWTKIFTQAGGISGGVNQWLVRTGKLIVVGKKWNLVLTPLYKVSWWKKES